MREITKVEIKKRLAFDNPWWESGAVDERFRNWPKRAYFDGFAELLEQSTVRRAVVLMGPRRVGKTVIIHQAIQKLIDDGAKPRSILYVSVDTPVYTGLSLERLFDYFQEIHGHSLKTKLFVFYDEIQYHPDWERHLKSLVDSFSSTKFIASGSAAAALKMRSRESGAGRFTEFLLPPLNFREFLQFQKFDPDWTAFVADAAGAEKKLNQAFIDYINFGGFPEAVIDENVRGSMDRYIANDIVDKVLLRDLPSLYGIADTQELKRFFSVLAYNSGGEVSMEGLSRSSGVAKNTIRKYLDYLEAAFLIYRLYRVDETARRFKRNNFFKVYLTNPSIRSALFEPVGPDDEAMGGMAETAVVAQIVQSDWSENFCYARWKQGKQEGEVDLVVLDVREQRAALAIEIKWSDRAVERPKQELRSLFHFCERNRVALAFASTRRKFGRHETDRLLIHFMPTAYLCLVFSEMLDSALRAGIHPATGEYLSEKGKVDAALATQLKEIVKSNPDVLKIWAPDPDLEAAYKKVLDKVPDNPPVEGDELD
jgi:hypothetical protein